MAKRSLSAQSSDARKTRSYSHHGYAVSGKHRPEYNTWQGMKARCNNAADKDYKWYGAKGIEVCDRWRFGANALSGFQLFLLDMGDRPANMTLDRRDPNGNYSPENCRWATLEQQAVNKRGTRFVTLNGDRMSLYAAIEILKRAIDSGIEVEYAVQVG